MEYRNELKFMVSDSDLERIRYRLLPLMKQDEHQGIHGYRVSGVYFDDIYDSYLSENEAGTDNRKKYRIRLYNGDSELIHLERKSKYRGMTGKMKQKLTREEGEFLIAGNLEGLHDKMASEDDFLLREVCMEILRKKLRAKCIVEYERFAFVESTGNVRITFDRNVSGSRQVESFFEEDIVHMPVMPRGWHILEIKYDELLPHYILQAVDTGTLRRQSFSKYCAVRRIVG